MKHSIFHLFAAAFALAAVVSGCRTVDSEAPGQKEIRFTASVGNFSVKATDSAFEDGDMLSLFADYPVSAWNVAMTAQGNTLIPETPVYWGDEQYVDEPAAFFACYPYNEALTRYYDLRFTVPADQSLPENYQASDLMTAAAYATPAEGNVHFRFTHRLSKLLIHVDNQLGMEIRRVQVGTLCLGMNYDITDNGWHNTNGTYGTLSACKVRTADGDIAWAVIFPPQSSQIELVLECANGDLFTYQSEYEFWFGPSRIYNAYVTVDNKSFAIDFSSEICDWIEGGDIPFVQDQADVTECLYTEIIENAVDESYSTVEGVKVHRLECFNTFGQSVAQFALVLRDGVSNLSGVFLSKEYAYEPYTCLSGYDLTVWGQGYGGSYYFAADGSFVGIVPGEAVYVDKLAENTYGIYGNGFHFVATKSNN